jgi:thiamine-monophosphate kinase
VLSDLAAVGSDPLGILLSVSLPPHDAEAVQEKVARGVREACHAAGISVLGGDTNEAPTLSVTVVGAALVPADAVITRVGTQPGDHVFVAGGIGLGAALAAARLLGAPGFGENDYWPTIRIPVGRALRGIASAAMDTSDGLLATLDQLARINGCAIAVEAPLSSLLHPRASALCTAVGLPPFAFFASHHGEFELVFTLPPTRLDHLGGVRAAIGAEPLRIGVAAPGDGLTIGGKPIDGARVRNLLQEVGGDPAAYVAALLQMAVG